ncbi:PPE family protein [Mycobacterium simiae]|uniref:PPE family protein n=1 Tax=Mycobacterium simiae TaxID=1784 RepID=UPI00260E61CD|nr:PPE domain-containing protein [Mycobacterium simiae]
MDFAALPPEVISGRMYVGAGSGPLVGAAAAWGALAQTLSFTASSYRAVVSELAGGPWLGPSSLSMVAAVAPYVSWLSSSAEQVGQTASQAGLAVAAYEAAFAVTVPPAEIELNRALLASLVATNVFGQNTPAIAATEAQYAQMWAQDVSMMQGYAEASAAATRLTPFTAPSQTTNPDGTANQGTSVGEAAASAAGPGAQSALSNVPHTLQTLAAGSSNPLSPISPGGIFSSDGGSGLNTFTENVGNWALVLSGPLFTASGITPILGGLYGLAVPTAAAVAGDVTPVDPGLGTLVHSRSPGPGSVSAGVGTAATVGELSVPQSWGSSPAIRLASSTTQLPVAGLGAVPQVEGAAPFFGGIPPVGSLVNAPRGEQTRIRSGPAQKVVPSLPGEPDVAEHPPGHSAQPRPARRHVSSALSESEREELAKLRKEIAEVATERDAAARLIKEAML